MDKEGYPHHKQLFYHYHEWAYCCGLRQARYADTGQMPQKEYIEGG